MMHGAHCCPKCGPAWTSTSLFLGSACDEQLPIHGHCQDAPVKDSCYINRKSCVLPEGGFQESQLPFSSHWPVDCRQRSEHCVCARHARTVTHQNKHCIPQFKSSTVGSKATRCKPQHHWTNGPLQIPSITLDGTWTEKEPPLFKSRFWVKLWKLIVLIHVDTAFRHSHSQQTYHHACRSRPASFQLRSSLLPLLPLRVLES